MKKNKLAIACFVLAMCAPVLGNAQGIPTMGAAEIALSIKQHVETVKHYVDQINAVRAQVDAVKQQYAAITGIRGLGDILNNPALRSVLPDDVNGLITTAESLPQFKLERGKFPTFQSRPKANLMYDRIAAQKALMADMYKKAAGRVAQVKDLMAKIDTAEDPAAKQDLANRLASEQNAISAQLAVFDAAKEIGLQEIDAASRAAQQESICKEFKRASC